ncbi:hypothetical protein [Spongiactinospora gelatinilytica]|uniref:hypothetical protein n=1 Tax=Spongiactinospora gelatinilytica TaxID=2666298 RepID=UPI0011B94299|nr:hypothetical protein [Spongiactinospora gelatinilytica]
MTENKSGRIKVEFSPLGTARWLHIWEINDPTSRGVHMSRAGFSTWLEAVKEGAFTPEEQDDLLRLKATSWRGRVPPSSPHPLPGKGSSPTPERVISTSTRCGRNS